MEKINAIKGGTEVQVNDNGDTIVCNFGSQEFYADFIELIDNLEICSYGRIYEKTGNRAASDHDWKD